MDTCIVHGMFEDVCFEDEVYCTLKIYMEAKEHYTYMHVVHTTFLTRRIYR